MSLLFTGRQLRPKNELWTAHDGRLVTDRWVSTTMGLRVADTEATEASLVTQDDHALRLATRRVEVGLTVGHPVRKDMDLRSVPGLEADYAPGGVAIEADSHTASYWIDWGNDIFDRWGYFYIFDVTTRSYFFPNLQYVNQPDGVLSTEVFEAFERTFTIVHGYPVSGIYKFDVTCNDDSPFIFGAYGDMGSDGHTVNTDETYAYHRNGETHTLYYNRNLEVFEDGEVDEIERFFSYFVPHHAASDTKTYQRFIYEYDDFSDNLSLFSIPVTRGIAVYFSKKNDVREWVVQDLAAGVRNSNVLSVNGNATIRGRIEASNICVIGGGELVPTGTIVMYPIHDNGVPDGWLACDGSYVQYRRYARLAKILGAVESPEGGEFALPNLPPTGPDPEVLLVQFIIKT